MKIYIASVIFANNTSKIKYAGLDKEKAFSFTTGEHYIFTIETWENEKLTDTEIIN